MPQIGKVEAAYLLFFMAGVLTGLGLWYAIALVLLALFYHHSFVKGSVHD